METTPNPWTSGLTTACGVFGCVTASKHHQLGGGGEGDGGGGGGGGAATAAALGYHEATPRPGIDVSKIICLGLVALQHRGQESAGIVTSEPLPKPSIKKKTNGIPRPTSIVHNNNNSIVSGKEKAEKAEKAFRFHSYKSGGLVSQIFSDTILQSLKGQVGIGHNRYSTAGGVNPANFQPFVVETLEGRIAIAHNGELVNAVELRREILQRGVGLSTTSDSELLVQILSMPPKEEVKGVEEEEEKEEEENGIDDQNGVEQDKRQSNGKHQSPTNIPRPPTSSSSSRTDWAKRIRHLMSLTPLSYSLLVMHEDRIFAARDPYGNRPLCLGTLLAARRSGSEEGSVGEKSESSDDGCSAVCTCGGEEGEGGGAASSSAAIVCRRNGGNVNIKESSSDDGINSGCSGESSRRSSTSSSSPSIGSAERVDGWVVSSESCAFTSIGAKFCRDVLPGEIVEISPQGIRSICIVPRPKATSPALCIFEYVYFARADSVIEGQTVYNVRRRCGQQLALEYPVKADVVSTVPESATPAAMGYADKSGIPYMEVLIKNRYIGRTFIQPSNRQRQLGVTKKFGPLTENFIGKRVVLVDDSIVRGNTIIPIIQMLRDHGAKEVHIRVASPPVRHPCFMGINIPTKDELLINQIPKEELTSHLNADSVEYLSVQGLVHAVEMMRVVEDKVGDVVKDKVGDVVEEKVGDVVEDTVGDVVGDKIEDANGKRKNGKHEDEETQNGNSVDGLKEDGDEEREVDAKVITRNGSVQTCPKSSGGHCTACLTGEYPVRPQTYADLF